MTDDDGRGAARTTDPATSHEAADAVDAVGLEALWVDTIRKHAPPGDGLTAAEVAAITGLPINTVSPRTAPLARKKRIFNTGITRVNPETNRRQIVWALM